MQDITIIAPIPLRRPTVSLTEKGANLLALIRTQEAQPGGWPWLAAELDRRISALLDDEETAEFHLGETGELAVRKESWL